MALIRSTIRSARASVRLRKIPWATAPWKDNPLVAHGDVDCANLFEGSSLDRYCRHEGGEADQGGVDQAYAAARHGEPPWAYGQGHTVPREWL